tara:strand:+ start:1801 stop:2022 length:222 start_codon:yes stop_codon:yes gene_type:complete
MYEFITNDPADGKQLWRVTECKTCEGRGRIWYPGCGDSAATCQECDGAGEVGKYRKIDFRTGKPYGPWRSDCH